MKTKLLALAFFYFLANVAIGQNIKPEPIHHVTIYKWAKDKDSVEHEAIVTVDAEGNVSVIRRDDGGEDTYNPSEKFDMKNLEKGFFSFINDKKIQHTPAYGQDAIGEATEPVAGKQILHITVVTIKDFNDKGINYYPGEYFTTLTEDFKENQPDALFNSFKKQERKLLRKFLYETLK